MNKPQVKPGDRVFCVRKDLDGWEPGYILIYARRVKNFEEAIPPEYYETRIIDTKGEYWHKWFLTREEAERSIVPYIEEQLLRIEAMRSEINSNQGESKNA